MAMLTFSRLVRGGWYRVDMHGEPIGRVFKCREGKWAFCTLTWDHPAGTAPTRTEAAAMLAHRMEYHAAQPTNGC